MSAAEYQDWIRYAKKVGGVSPHRRLERKLDVCFGRLMHLLACIHRDPKKPAPKLEDFLPPKEYEDDDIGDMSQVADLFSRIGAVSTGTSGVKWKRKRRK